VGCDGNIMNVKDLFFQISVLHWQPSFHQYPVEIGLNQSSAGALFLNRLLAGLKIKCIKIKLSIIRSGRESAFCS
jgi:hypothetical protein